MHLFLKKMKAMLIIMLLAVMVMTLSQCTNGKDKIVILSGSENDTLVPILQQFTKETGIDVEMHYKGSVDIMLALQNNVLGSDAVWPANSLWISMGDKNSKVKYAKSIMTSPVVFGIKMSLAQKLGFVGKQVSVNDLLAAIMSKKMTFMMTSATQSNSGASAYMGFIYSFLGNPDTISIDDLKKPELKSNIRQLLAGVNRSSGSSAWLKDLFLKGDYDAMVNYEALIIETNNELIKQGKEPLYLVYPYDGLVISDSPLGYIDNGNVKKEENFKKLQEYLLSENVQKQILALGRRTGFGGMLENADPKVFNPNWGIDTKKILSPIRMPSADVIQEALNLYQTEFKKPSYTVFCLDFSGSMSGEREAKVKEAMKILLDQDTARQYMLNSSAEDTVVVKPFSDTILSTWKVIGNDNNQMSVLLQDIDNTGAGGSTDIYSPVIEALEDMKLQNLDKYITSVVLMTDGESNTGKEFKDLQNEWQSLNKDIPVFSIMFGEASQDQLQQIADLTRAKVFDGKTDLVDAFKKVRGYN